LIQSRQKRKKRKRRITRRKAIKSINCTMETSISPLSLQCGEKFDLLLLTTTMSRRERKNYRKKTSYKEGIKSTNCRFCAMMTIKTVMEVKKMCKKTRKMEKRKMR
jgi:hypothetical protein